MTGALAATLAIGVGGARAGADAAAADALTADRLARFVGSHAPELKACYDVARARTPGISGRLDVTWTIDTSGKASRIGFGDRPPADAEFGACLTRTIAAWRFPAPKEPTDITYPFVFQSARGGPDQPVAAAPDSVSASRGPGWEAAQKWLAALGRHDVETVARLTSFPLRYRTVGLRRDCVTDSRDAAGLKRWMQCLRKAKSQITGEIAAGARIEYSTRPDRELDKASQGLTGGEWVPASLDGDGVTLGFRLLVAPASEGAGAVKAFVVAASADKR